MNTHDAIKNAHEHGIVCCNENFQFSKRLLTLTKNALRKLGFKAEKWIIDDLMIADIESWFFRELSGLNHPDAKICPLNIKDNLTLFGVPVVFEEDLIEKYKIIYKDTEEKIFYPAKWTSDISVNSFIICVSEDRAIFGGYYYPI